MQLRCGILGHAQLEPFERRGVDAGGDQIGARVADERLAGRLVVDGAFERLAERGEGGFVNRESCHCPVLLWKLEAALRDNPR